MAWSNSFFFFAGIKDWNASCLVLDALERLMCGCGLWVVWKNFARGEISGGVHVLRQVEVK